MAPQRKIFSGGAADCAATSGFAAIPTMTIRALAILLAISAIVFAISWMAIRLLIGGRRRSLPWRWLALGAGLTGLPLALWAFWWEPASLRLVSYHLELPGWPADCSGLRVAILADLHVGSPWNGVAKLERIVAATNAAGVDLVVLPGDFVIHDVVGGTLVEPKAIAAGLAPLRAPLGVYAVLGNHDWWFNGEGIRAALEANGIRVLQNEAVQIGGPGQACRFSLAGLGDLWNGRPDVRTTLRRLPEDGAVIAITHNPDLFPRLPRRVALLIAGHTHGGQVALPVLGRLIVPSRFGERFAIGHVVEDGRHLFVASGLGTSILPVRFRVPPEVSILELAAPGAARATILDLPVSSAAR